MRWWSAYFFLCNLVLFLRVGHHIWNSLHFFSHKRKQKIEGKHKVIFILYFYLVKLGSLMFLVAEMNPPKVKFSDFSSLQFNYETMGCTCGITYFIIWLFINGLFNFAAVSEVRTIFKFLQMIGFDDLWYLLDDTYNKNISQWKITMNVSEVIHFEKGLYVRGRRKRGMTRRHTMYWV